MKHFLRKISNMFLRRVLKARAETLVVPNLHKIKQFCSRVKSPKPKLIGNVKSFVIIVSCENGSFEERFTSRVFAEHIGATYLDPSQLSTELYPHNIKSNEIELMSLYLTSLCLEDGPVVININLNNPRSVRMVEVMLPTSFLERVMVILNGDVMSSVDASSLFVHKIVFEHEKIGAYTFTIKQLADVFLARYGDARVRSLIKGRSHR